MAALVYHVISNEVENRIFRHNPIFRHTSMYKQPILIKQWNHNIFVEILYSCLRDTDRLLGVFFSLLAVIFPIDTGRKLNVHKTFRIRLGRLLNVLCRYNLHPVSTWTYTLTNLQLSILDLLSSNINEVIRSILNFLLLLLLFFTKRFYKYKKAQNRLQQTKIKKYVQKISKGKKSLIRLFRICAFAWFCFYAFSVFSAFSACKKYFVKNKEFKRL